MRRSAAASSTSIFAIRNQSILPLSADKLQRIATPSRSFHSSILHSYNVASRRARVENEAPRGSTLEGLGDNGELVTNFQDLADRGLVDANVIDQIVRGMGHHTMTPVQSMTINETLKGTDV